MDERATIRGHPRGERDGAKRGAALFFVMAILGFLGVLGVTTFTVSRVDFHITGNKVAGAQAFYQADAGIQYVKNRLERELVQGRLLSDLTTNINIPPPPGLQFDAVDQMAQLTDTNLYAFSVTGRHRKARATIEAVIRQSLAIDMGLFGDELLYLAPNLDIYSYYSHLVPNPTPANSVGGAVAGSNENLVIRPNTHIDGHYVIGRTPLGAVGSYPAGHPVVEVDRIDPDPLGAVGGFIAARIARARSQNDNAGADAISGTRLQVKNHKTKTLPAGTYYLTHAEVRSHATLNVDTGGGAVTIYLEGGFETWPGCDINVSGNPADFRIFSNSTELIWLRPNNTLKLFIYAPYADVRVWPNAMFCGAIWAKDIDLHPNGDVFIDLTLLEKIKSNRISIVSWKEIRN